jgi:hypothetical protein
VTEPSSHLVHPADETRHSAGPEHLWGESYYMDFVTDDASLGGYIRVGWYPNLGVVWFAAAIVEPGRPTIMAVSFDAPASDLSATSAAGPNYSVHVQLKSPLDTLLVKAEAVGESLADVGAVYRREKGEPVELGLELSWRTDGQPFHYGSMTRYEIPCLVAGTLRLADRTVAVRGQGQRDHSWGVRDWWEFGWCWSSARLTDGTRVHAVDARVPGLDLAFGYVQDRSGSLVIVTSADVSEHLGPEGFPTRGRAILNGGLLELDIEPLAFGPLLLVAPDGRITRFPRAMARFSERKGRTGLGWIEWNQPEPH